MSDDAPRPIGRRRLLGRGLGVAVLLGSGALFVNDTRGYFADPEVLARLHVLDAKEYVIVSELFDVLLEGDTPDSTATGLAAIAWPTHEDVDAIARFDTVLARLDAANRRDARLLLQALEHTMPRALGHRSRFSRLAAHERREVLEGMENHAIGLVRGAFSVLKGLAAMSYFASDGTWEPLGYDGPLVGRPREGWVAASRLTRAR